MSPDARLVACGWRTSLDIRNAISVFDVASGAKRELDPGHGQVRSLAFSPDGGMH
jgi:hypothetical protein